MRILLLQATFELMDAAIREPAHLALLLGAEVAPGWEGFPESLPGLRRVLEDAGGPLRWGPYLFVLESPRTLVGIGGYRGGPTPDGIVELGYSIAPTFQRRGFATEATMEMVRRAFEDPSVRAVDAHTLAEPNPSTRVLEKAGFRKIGVAVDPDDGTIWHWRRDR